MKTETTSSKDDGRSAEERFEEHFAKVAEAEAKLKALREAHAKRMQS